MTTTATGDAKGTTGTSQASSDDGVKGTTGAPEGKSLIGAAADQNQSGEAKKGEGGEPKGQESTSDFKLNIPDGVDPAKAQPFIDLAKKHGIEKVEAVQEIFDSAQKMLAEAVEAQQSEVETVWTKTQEEWITNAKQDKEFGGAAFQENIGIAHKAVVRFGGDALVKVLDESGLGNHPEVIRAFLKVGKAISEDSISGTTGGTGPKARDGEKARLMREYPNSPDLWKHLPD